MEKSNTDENGKDLQKTLAVKRGEIFWCYLGINVGSEQNGAGSKLTRPVVVIAIFSDRFFLVAPLTTKKHEGDWYLNIAFNDSCVILNQIRPVDIKRLRQGIGNITDQELNEIIDKYIKLIR